MFLLMEPDYEEHKELLQLAKDLRVPVVSIPCQSIDEAVLVDDGMRISGTENIVDYLKKHAR